MIFSERRAGILRESENLMKLAAVFQALVTTELEGGDRQKAMKRLRVPPLGAAQVRHAHG